MDNNSIGLTSESPEATEAVGSLLGSVLIPGDIVLLDGDLGAGKTVLTRGIASGLGLAPHVTSPTYTLVFEHLAEDRAATDLFHFDVYRISGSEEFLLSGLDEYFERGGVCVIEWGEKILSALPVSPIRIELSGVGPERSICILFPEGNEERCVRLRALLLNCAGIRL
jgi:tRNA threonylcarbamoyladenosine biosynthesis protein TsaE